MGRNELEKIEDVPDDDGLWVGDVKTGQNRLLISILRVAEHGEKKRINSGYPHYLTHPTLNPTGKRIAFLHRYRVVDGGEVTRLMTIGVDGQDLRCLAKGFLSHFTWVSDDEIFIWGAHQPSLYAIREKPYLRFPCVEYSTRIAKNIIRYVRDYINKGDKSLVRNSMSFLKIKDSDICERIRIGEDVLTEDGHPMANPTEGSFLVNDTYPNKNGDRTLMLYDIKCNKRYDIGVYRMLNCRPDMRCYNWQATQYGTDRRIIEKFNKDLYMFARSGFHCDLHPRWSWDGKKIYFDSIHEGSRQIYVASIER